MSNFTIVNAPQRSPEWMAARAGLVTGSKADIMFMGEKTAGREDFIMQLAIERITGKSVDDDFFISKEMQRGIDKEPECINAIEMRDGSIIRATGFLRHNTLPIGISLDGDFDDFSMTLEAKCPKSKTHLRYLQEKLLPKAYVPQVAMGFYVTGAKENMFASFDDRMPSGLELFTVVTRVEDIDMELFEKVLMAFLRDVDNMQDKLLTMQKAA